MAMTALPAPVLPFCSYTAEQAVQMVKVISIPIAAVRNSFLRPSLSTVNAMEVATKKDHSCRPPLIKAWLYDEVMPMDFRISAR